MLTAVEDVDPVLAVDAHRCHVAEFPAVGQLGPVLDHAIAMLAAAQDHRHCFLLWPRSSDKGCCWCVKLRCLLGCHGAIIAAEIFSAVMSVGKLVLAQGTTGNTEASTTRRLCTPLTRPWVSTTDLGSSGRPMRQEQEACHTPIAALRTNASSASSSVITWRGSK